MSTSQLREDKHYYFMYKNNCIHLFCIRSGCINNVLIVKSNSKTCLLFFFHNVDTILQPFEKKNTEPEVIDEGAEVVCGGF